LDQKDGIQNLKSHRNFGQHFKTLFYANSNIHNIFIEHIINNIQELNYLIKKLPKYGHYQLHFFTKFTLE